MVSFECVMGIKRYTVCGLWIPLYSSEEYCFKYLGQLLPEHYALV